MFDVYENLLFLFVHLHLLNNRFCYNSFFITFRFLFDNENDYYQTNSIQKSVITETIKVVSVKRVDNREILVFFDHQRGFYLLCMLFSKTSLKISPVYQQPTRTTVSRPKGYFFYIVSLL